MTPTNIEGFRWKHRLAWKISRFADNQCFADVIVFNRWRVLDPSDFRYHLIEDIKFMLEDGVRK